MTNTFKAELIYDYMKQHKLSKAAFCKLCKISVQTLNKILANKFNFRVVALFKIARVTKIQVYQMYN